MFRSSVYMIRLSLTYIHDMHRLSAFLYRLRHFDQRICGIKILSALSLRGWVEVACTAFHITLISQMLSKTV